MSVTNPLELSREPTPWQYKTRTTRVLLSTTDCGACKPLWRLLQLLHVLAVPLAVWLPSGL